MSNRSHSPSVFSNENKYLLWTGGDTGIRGGIAAVIKDIVSCVENKTK